MSIFIIILTLTSKRVICSLIQEAALATANIPQDARLNFTELAHKYELKCVAYNISTEDGYILTVFNVEGNRKRPLFLMHGFIDSADTFIIRINNSLVFHLHKAGYDIWLGNTRGNKYSRAHLTLDPDTDNKYWNFSFHEIGYYDLPATIDFILNKTSQSQLQVIGHSQGTSVVFVLGSTRPEYNDKIKVFIAMGPIAYLSNAEPPLSTLTDLAPVLSDVLKLAGKEEIIRNNSDCTALLKLICITKLLGKVVCEEGYFQNLFGGRDSDTFSKDFLPVASSHYFCGTSRKNAEHLSQIRKNFTYFDYGLINNLQVYGSAVPPSYNLKSITMKTALLVGNRDKVSTVKDVEHLREELKNVVYYRLLEREEMNHFDFVWGDHAYVYLFPHIFEILEKYN